MDDLKNLISTLDNMVAGYHVKQAGITVDDVLKGDRTDTDPAGEPAENTDKEMTDESFKKRRPVEDSVKDNKGEEFNLSEDRAKKAAKLAEEILVSYKRASDVNPAPENTNPSNNTGKTDNSKKRKEKEKEEEKEKGEPSEEKKAFYQGLALYGADYLHKVASLVDPEYNALQEYVGGEEMAKMAFSSMQKNSADKDFTTGAQLADTIMSKVANVGQQEINKQSYIYGVKAAEAAVSYSGGVQSAQETVTKVASYEAGARLANNTITKVAADLLAVRPVIQEMQAKNLLTQEEKDQLIEALASSDQLTPEVVRSATGSLSNAEVVAAAILKAMEGTQGVNVPMEPTQPKNEPTKSPATAGVNGSTGGEKKNLEDQLMIQAALKVLEKRQHGR